MSGWLAQLSWHEPLWLLLALCPLLPAWLAHRRRRALTAYADAHLLPWAVVEQGNVKHALLRAVFNWFAWGLLAIALAGPRLPLAVDMAAVGEQDAPHRMSLMVVLDLSASMGAADVSPNRLSRARLELTDLLKRLHGERIGLVVFAGEAGMLLPPTDDKQVFAGNLAQANPDLFESPGTNLGAALTLAQQAMQSERHRAVLLVSDGDGMPEPALEAARKAANDLAQAGIPLYVLGVGSEAGAPVPLSDGGFAERDGVQVISHLNTGLLRQLANAGDGRFAVAQDGDADWSALYDHGIATLPGDAVAPGQAKAWRELYAVPLSLALLIFAFTRLPSIKRGAGLTGLVTVLMVAASMAPRESLAAGEEQAAWAAYRSGNFEAASRLYRQVPGYAGYLGAGAAAWKLHDYDGAAQNFSAALVLAGNREKKLDALYNLGNALFAQGQWQSAIDAYLVVLVRRPKDQRVLTNLALAQRQLNMRRGWQRDSAGSDLQGHRGMLVQGMADIQQDNETVVQELKPDPPRVQIDRERKDASGAHVTGEAASQYQTLLDARRLESGTRKLRFLQDQPKPLLRNLMKQDTPSGAHQAEVGEW